MEKNHANKYKTLYGYHIQAHADGKNVSSGNMYLCVFFNHVYFQSHIFITVNATSTNTLLYRSWIWESVQQSAIPVPPICSCGTLIKVFHLFVPQHAYL